MPAGLELFDTFLLIPVYWLLEILVKLKLVRIILIEMFSVNRDDVYNFFSMVLYNQDFLWVENILNIYELSWVISNSRDRCIIFHVICKQTGQFKLAALYSNIFFFLNKCPVWLYIFLSNKYYQNWRFICAVIYLHFSTLFL